MNMFNHIFANFNRLYPRPIPQQEFEEACESCVRNLVARYSEGNVHLQAGQYITQSQADNERKQALACKF